MDTSGDYDSNLQANSDSMISSLNKKKGKKVKGKKVFFN